MNNQVGWLTKKPIAHRGLHTDELPENSLAAYKNAIDRGYPIEIDIRLIDDGTVVVFHDDALGRMTGADGYAATLKLSDLDNLRLGGSDEKIPTFEQVLELVNGQVPLLIETKVGNVKVGALESKSIEMLKTYGGEFAMQSFNPYSMEYYKLHAPDFMRGQLAAMFKKNSGLKAIERFMLSRLKMNKVSDPQFVSYCFSDLPNKYVNKSGLPTLAWTVRSGADYNNIKDCCDQIIFEGFIPKTEADS